MTNAEIIARTQGIMIEARNDSQMNTVTMRIVRKRLAKELSLTEEYLNTKAMRLLVKQTVEGIIAEFAEGAEEVKMEDAEIVEKREESAVEEEGAEEEEDYVEPEPKVPAKRKASTSSSKPATKKRAVGKEFKSAEMIEDSDAESQPLPPPKKQKESSDTKENVKAKKGKAKDTGDASDKSTPAKPAAKSKAKASTTLSKDEERLKNLKKIVGVCGKRPIWKKEFTGMENSTTKQIARVKEILVGLGMTGRMTMEQAKQVKEKREFEEELASVKEFEKKHARTGRRSAKQSESDAEESEAEEEEEDGAPAKSKANLRQSIMAFIGDEESD